MQLNIDLDELYDAIVSCHQSTVKELMIKHNLSPNTVFIDKSTQHSNVRTPIYEKVDPSCLDTESKSIFSILDEVYKAGDYKTVKYILEFETINFNQINSTKSVLGYQIENPEIVKMTVIHPCYDVNALNIPIKLLKRRKELTTLQHDTDICLLHYYCGVGNSEMVGFLLQIKDINPNVKEDFLQKVPLLYAATDEIRKKIIDHAVFDPNVKTFHWPLITYYNSDSNTRQLIKDHPKYRK